MKCLQDQKVGHEFTNGINEKNHLMQNLQDIHETSTFFSSLVSPRNFTASHSQEQVKLLADFTSHGATFWVCHRSKKEEEKILR